MRRTVLLGTTALLVLVLAGCGGDDETEAAPTSEPATTAPTTPLTSTPTSTSATATPTATPTATSSSDVLPGIVSGTPTDLRWRVPTVPSSWKKLPTDEGEAQWQVGATCAVTLSQPAGLGTAKDPTQSQVLITYARRLEKAVGGRLTIQVGQDATLPLVTTDRDVVASTKVSRASLTRTGGVEGEIYAYRGGDFALVATTLCGKGAFAATDASDLQPFLKALAISAQY